MKPFAMTDIRVINHRPIPYQNALTTPHLNPWILQGNPRLSLRGAAGDVAISKKGRNSRQQSVLLP